MKFFKIIILKVVLYLQLVIGQDQEVSDLLIAAINDVRGRVGGPPQIQ